jgi:threonine aldolase
VIDLFSDSATKPTQAMRQTMAAAECGDEQRGLDPTINRLLSMSCALLGKEAALFLPTGTMCNAVAMKVHTKPGDCVLVDRLSHILRLEAGGTAMWSGVVFDQLPTEDGTFTAADVVAAIPEPSINSPKPMVLSVEQPHNLGGGTVWQLEQIASVCKVAHQAGLRTHMDGARLFNAVVATGVPATKYSEHFDSVWIDFSKSLAAPFGAVLAGDKKFIDKARRYKQAFGGAMRQAGIMAAACIYALENNIERLAEDHENTQYLATELGKIKGLKVLTPKPHTNMVYFDPRGTGMSADTFLKVLEKQGVIMSRLDEHRVRAVPHLGISREDCQCAVAVVQQVVASGNVGSASVAPVR